MQLRLLTRSSRLLNNKIFGFFSRLLGVAILACGFISQPVLAAQSEPVVIASKIDGEGALLGNILVQLFENADIAYINKVQMATTSVLRQALLAGEIDIYPEYTGNAAFMLNEPDNPVWRDLQQGYETAKKLDRERNQLIWLAPAPANNTWAIAVREDLADKYQLNSLTDLQPALAKGMEFKIAAGAEFIERTDALPSFENIYQFKLSQDQILAFPGNDTTVFIKTAAEYNSGVNAAVVYGTDGSLLPLGLKVLKDPKGAQPVYAPAPVIRASVLQKHPQIAQLLEPVFASLTTKTLQRLNGAISIDGFDAKTVAHDYLSSQGFLK